jgi:hypothetical protein
VDGDGEDASVLLMTGTVFGGGVGAPIAGAPMKAQARLGLALSWRWITSAFLIDVAVLILASHLPGAPQTVAWWVVNRLTGRQLAAVRASLPSPAKRPPLVVPTRTLREDEQLTLRVGPTEADAAPQHSMRPAARRAMTRSEQRQWMPPMPMGVWLTGHPQGGIAGRGSWP